MAGDWLAALGQALTTTDTFEHIVAPAVADLQHEAGGRTGKLWRAYVAVWLTLASGVAQDFRLDARATFDQTTVLRMLKVSAWAVLLLVVAPRLWAMAEIGFDRRAEMVFSIASTPSAFASALPVLMLSLSAVVAGRRHGRTVLFAAAAVASVVFTLQAIVIPRVQHAWATPAMRAILGVDLDGLAPQLAVRETMEEYVGSAVTGQPFGPVFLDEPYSERRDVGRTQRTAAIAGTLAFALCGSALRLKRDWAIVALTVPVYLLWMWSGLFATVWMSGLGFNPTFRGWLPTMAVFACGVAATAIRLVIGRRALVRETRS